MAIKVPGKRFGKRFQRSKVFGHGPARKRLMNADLLITPLVDMFVIIVLFLIANFSATGEVLMMKSDIRLPEAVNVKDVELAPVVMVSKDHVLVSGTVVGRIEDLVRDEYLNIPALEEKLRDLKKQYEELHALAKDDTGNFKGDVNIQADKNVQFRIIKRVMFSCNTAGYYNTNYAVISMGTEKAGEKTASN